MGRWIHLYDSETGEAQSSWVRSFTWRSMDEDDESGVLILRRFDDNPEETETYRYENVPRSVYDELREAAASGGSVGALVNRRVIQNEDVPPATKLE